MKDISKEEDPMKGISMELQEMVKKYVESEERNMFGMDHNKPNYNDEMRDKIVGAMESGKLDFARPLSHTELYGWQ